MIVILSLVKSQGSYLVCQSYGVFNIFRFWLRVFGCTCLTNHFINLIISVVRFVFVSLWVSCTVVVCTGVVTASSTMVCLVGFIWLFEIPSHLPCGFQHFSIMVQFTGGNRQLYIWVIVTIKLISNTVFIIRGVSFLVSVRGSFSKTFGWCMII